MGLRSLLCGGLLLAVLVGARGAVPGAIATAQGAVQVQDTGAQVVLTFANGHRLHWTKANCTLADWRDGGGQSLGSGLEFQADMPFGYGYQLQPTNPHVTGVTTAGASATVACLGDWAAAPGTAYSFTLAAATRDWGTAYAGLQWQVSVDLPLSNLSVGIAALHPAGQALGFTHWTVTPDSDGLQQVNYLQPEASLTHGATQQTFSLVTHPAGAYVAFVPDVRAGDNFTGFTTRPAYPAGVALYKEFAAVTPGTRPFQTPPFGVLFSAAAAGQPMPQTWLDVRFGVLAEQWAGLGLGRQHLHTPLDGSLIASESWADTATASYQQQGLLAWGQYDGNRQFLTTGMFQGPRGTAANINSTSQVGDPEYNLPNATDLPAVIPGVTFAGQLPLQEPKGPGYTQGTMADLRTLLAHQRILGILPGMWHRDYYPGCVPSEADPNNATQWSRWDKTWTCSILWKFHADWGQQLADGSLDPAPQAFPNNRHPGYTAWKGAWHRYWLDLGLMGFFRDTGCMPCTGGTWYDGTYASQSPGEWAYLVDLLRHGGAYVSGENPLLFSYTVGNRDNPKYDGGKEWSTSFTTGGWGGYYDPGTNVFIYDHEMDWDRRVAHRLHTVAAANPCCGVGTYESLPPTGLGEIRAENEAYAQFVAQHGIPDRIVLINPQNVGSAGTVLKQPLAASGATSAYVDNPFRLPLTGRVRIGSETILYTAPDTGSCGHWAVFAGCNGITGLQRGYGGTPVSAHAVGDAVTPLDDMQHWDWDDAYWVYGQGAGEVWIKYSDGSVWQRGGTTLGAVPQIANVSVNGGTVTFATDMPASAWVEYDTFGAAEQWNGQRLAGLPPQYQQRAPAEGGDPPPSTSHSIALPALTPDALYHYRVVARGPAQAVTDDATFQVGAPAATPTRTPTRVPTRAAPASTPTATPSTTAPFYTTPSTVPVGGTSTVGWNGQSDPGLTIWLYRPSTNEWLQGDTYLNCTSTPPTQAVPSGTCALPLDAAWGAGAYRWELWGQNDAVLMAQAPFTIGTPDATATSVPTLPATATATPTATPSPTATTAPTRIPTATPTPSCRVYADRGSGPPTPIVQQTTAICQGG